MPTPPMPTITVSAALGQDPFEASPAWSPLPAFQSCSIRRGRQHSIGQFEAGTATLEWFDPERDFDPWHSAGDFGQYLKPGLKVQISAVWGAISKYRYTGYVERVVPLWNSPSHMGCRVELVDALKLFERRRYRVGHYREMVLSYNPRLYYQFKDDDGATVAEDASQNNNDGTYIGRDLVSVDGAIHTDPDDRALNCGGNDGAVKGPSGGGVSGMGSVGVAVLFYINALPGLGSFYQLFDQKILTGAPDEYVGLRVTDAGNVIFTEGSTGAAVITSPNTLAAGQWHYALWTRSGSAHTLHVNDVTATPVLTTMDDYEAHEPHFAADAGGTIRMNGSVDESVVYAGAVPFSGATGVGGDPLAHHREATRASGAGARTDEAIWGLLDEMGWPAADRALYANGVYTVAGIAGSINTSYLARMQQLIGTENGLLYMAENGVVSFIPELALSPPPSSTFTIGDGVSESHYPVGPIAEFTDEHIYNEFILSGDAVNEVYLLDHASKDAYGYRTLSQSGLLFEDNADIQARAERWRQEFREPKKAFRSVVIRGQDDPDVNFPLILRDLPLGAVGTVNRRPPVGSTVSVLSMVDQITDTITPDTWTCTLGMSPMA